MVFERELEKQIANLKKENAELKSRDCWKGCLYASGKSELIHEFLQQMYNLTKAKELLNEFMRISKASDEDFEHDYSELIEEAEQFLKGESTTSNECHDCAKFDEMPKGPGCKTCDNGSHFQKKEEA